MPNYSIVANTRFQNRSFDDLLRPLAMYTDVYNQQESAINELEEKASVWDGMANEQTDPIAYAQYKRFADDLKQKADTLASVGLNPQTRRSIMDMKRRYASEIVPIEQAYAALQEEKKRRRDSKDNSMLYATDMLNLDSFMNGKTPNLYSVSGDELYAKGAAVGKGFSSRIYDTEDGGHILGDYYRDYVQKMGYNPDRLNQFQQEMLLNGFTGIASSIPELQQAALSIIESSGAAKNLTGENLRRAEMSVLRGIVDNAVYSEDHKPIRDEGKMSAAQAASNALGWANHNRGVMKDRMEMRMNGFDPDTGKYLGAENDPNAQRAAAIAGAKNGGKGSSTSSSSGSGSAGGRGRSTEHQTKGKERLLFTWKGDPNVDTSLMPEPKTVADDEESHPGTIVSYNELPEFAKEVARKRVGRGKVNYYDYYYSPYNDGFLWMNDDAQLEMVPKDIITDDAIYYGEFEEDGDLDE